MTPTTLAPDPARATDFRVVALVGIAHFVSHIHIFGLPILFPFLRAEFGVSYTLLGGVIAIFNILTGALQTPAGLLVDRISGRAVLIGGLLLGSAALTVATLIPSFAVFTVMVALVGVANAIYHPADYSLLSNLVSTRRISQAYSIHIFAGHIGTAVSPALMIGIAQFYGWRGALLVVAAIGFAVAAALILFGDALRDNHPRRADITQEKTSNWRLLFSVPILLNLVFFMLLSMAAAGLTGYGIVALQAL